METVSNCDTTTEFSTMSRKPTNEELEEIAKLILDWCKSEGCDLVREFTFEKITQGDIVDIMGSEEDLDPGQFVFDMFFDSYTWSLISKDDLSKEKENLIFDKPYEEFGKFLIENLRKKYPVQSEKTSLASPIQE